MISGCGIHSAARNIRTANMIHEFEEFLWPKIKTGWQ